MTPSGITTAATAITAAAATYEPALMGPGTRAPPQYVVDKAPTLANKFPQECPVALTSTVYPSGVTIQVRLEAAFAAPRATNAAIMMAQTGAPLVKTTGMENVNTKAAHASKFRRGILCTKKHAATDPTTSPTHDNNSTLKLYGSVALAPSSRGKNKTTP
jgi:hypothetical protein